MAQTGGHDVKAMTCGAGITTMDIDYILSIMDYSIPSLGDDTILKELINDYKNIHCGVGKIIRY